MTTKSFICNFIKDNPDDWRERIKKRRILVKDEGDLSIFRYDIKANFRDALVCEARGIIINTKTLEVVCWPFTKFFEYEDYNSKLSSFDWDSAYAEDKIDGSMITLWFDTTECKWRFSSMGCTRLSDVRTPYGDSFAELIRDTEQFKILLGFINENRVLDKANTYIFEFVHPKAPVIIHYETPALYLTGIRRNVDGKEMYPWLPHMPVPNRVSVNSLSSCIDYVENTFNKSIVSNKVSCVIREGFVVVDKYYNRIKVKSPIYLIMHGIVAGSREAITLFLKLLSQNKIDLANICEDYPEHRHVLTYYEHQYHEFVYNAIVTVDVAKKVYTTNGNDRADLFKRLDDAKIDSIYKKVAGKALSRSLDVLTDQDVIDIVGINKIVRFIPKYTLSVNLRSVFTGIEEGRERVI